MRESERVTEVGKREKEDDQGGMDICVPEHKGNQNLL